MKIKARDESIFFQVATCIENFKRNEIDGDTMVKEIFEALDSNPDLQEEAELYFDRKNAAVKKSNKMFGRVTASEEVSMPKKVQKPQYNNQVRTIFEMIFFKLSEAKQSSFFKLTDLFFKVNY